jgi:hypothetical protein
MRIDEILCLALGLITQSKELCHDFIALMKEIAGVG